MKLQLEINSKACVENIHPDFLGMKVLMTPPLNEDFWLFRVRVSPNQAIVAFPKFGIFGVGFQKEEKDWNTNLPSNCDKEEIYNHIKENKGKGISRNICIAAIKIIQEAVKKAEEKDLTTQTECFSL